MMTTVLRMALCFGLSACLTLACASHDPTPSEPAVSPAPKKEPPDPDAEPDPEPVAAVEEPEPQPAADLDVDAFPKNSGFDGRSTPDTSSERNTEAGQGLDPIAGRMPGKRIEVETMREFVKALGSNRTIVMKPGVYVWNDGDVLGHVSGAESYKGLSKHLRDGTIRGVDNLTIVGMGAGARILQPDSYDHVLSFQDVRGLTLHNLVLGHEEDRGWCAGGVVRIIGGRDIVIDGLEMFGSGTEGLTFSQVEDVEVRHSVVWGCSEQLSTIFHANNVRIHDTVFRGSGPDLLRGFNLGRAQVQMQRVTIRNNRCAPPMQGYGTLFSDDSEYPDLPGVTQHAKPKVRVTGPPNVRVTFEDGVIRDNRFSKLSDNAQTVDIQRSTLARNGWD